MKTVKWIVAFVLLATLSSTAAWADPHGRVNHGRVHFGLMIGAPTYWGPWGYPPPPPYYYYPPYYPPAVVVERQAPVYIEQTPPAVATAPAPAPQNFWYYCAAAKGYYPYVKECPSGWQKVLPQPATP